jgi:SAM-dependent methyltransferase
MYVSGITWDGLLVESLTAVCGLSYRRRSRPVPSLVNAQLRAAAHLPDTLRSRAILRIRRNGFLAAIGDVGLARLDVPTPPDNLVAETHGFTADDAARHARPTDYLASSYHSAGQVLELADRNGVDVRRMTVLDFGCGAGKTLRAIREIPRIRCVGVDVNARQIEWAERHLPGIEFHVTGKEPPLPFEDGTFDLVYALSVFTHIPLELQRPWLTDLNRILRPNGLLLATVAGKGHIISQLGSLDVVEDGPVSLGPNDPGVSNASGLTGQQDVFQSRDEIVRVFGEELDLLSYVATTGQDMLVLRRR